MRLLLAISAALALLTLPLGAASEDAQPAGDAQQTAPTQFDLDRAARNYRIAVYNAFRTDRGEFERRNAAWRSIYVRWQKDGEKSAEIPTLVAWLRAATIASGANRVAALPPTPQPSQLAGRPQPEPQPTNDKRPTIEERAPLVEPAAPQLARRPTTTAPPQRQADTAALPDAPLPISPTVINPQRPSLPETDQATATTDEPRRRPAPVVAITPSTIAPPTVPPADVVDRSGDEHSPAGRSPEITVELVPDGIDVGEVAIRVAGHNLALATLVEDIRKAKMPTIEQVGRFAERLAAHAVRVQDLSPYYSLVSEQERPRLQPLAGIDPAVTLLRQRLTDLNIAITNDTALPETIREEQLARLAELERRLNQLSPATP